MWHDLQQRLKLRQLDLQLRSAELRVHLAQDVRALEEPLRWFDRAHAVLRLIRGLPRAWKALGALGGLGGLLGVVRLFGKWGGRRRGRSGGKWDGQRHDDAHAPGTEPGWLSRLFSEPGRVARLWTWLVLGRRVWRWLQPRPDQDVRDDRV